MLTEIWSSLFKQGDKPREPVTFTSGLNIILGTTGAKNSIGKSTLLHMINFAFGGQSWPKSGVSTMVGRHTVCFCFEIDNQRHYFVRIADPATDIARKVYPSDSTYTHLQDPMGIEEFRRLLAQWYQLDNTDLSFRSLVGLYARIATRRNLDPRKPLQESDSDSATKAIVRLEKTLQRFAQIKEQFDAWENSKSQLSAFDRANKAGVIVIKALNPEDAKEAVDTIEQLTREANASLKEDEDALIQLEDLKAQEADERDAQIQKLRVDYAKIMHDIRAAQKTMVSYDPPTQEDFTELLEFFPNISIERLTQVESYHRKIVENLTKQAQAELARLQAMRMAIGTELETLRKQRIETGSSTILPRLRYEEYADKKVRIRELEIAAKQSNLRESLRQANEDTEGDLVTKQDELLPAVAEEINAWIKELTTAFAATDRQAPSITFPTATSYTNNVPKDNGTGTGQKALILFDLAMLENTILSLIIHDTPMFAGLEHERLNTILHLYARQTKQVFIALDHHNALSPDSQDLVKEHTRIALGEGEKTLFGMSATDPHFAERIDHGPWPEGEPKISNSKIPVQLRLWEEK